jgi:hypothetical protein
LKISPRSWSVAPSLTNQVRCSVFTTFRFTLARPAESVAAETAFLPGRRGRKYRGSEQALD